MNEIERKELAKTKKLIDRWFLRSYEGTHGINYQKPYPTIKKIKICKNIQKTKGRKL